MNSDKTFFGHPRGLATLFFTEMWERFSYYGMRAILLLFMVTSVEKGGMGLDDKTGAAIYGLYTMFVYLLALPGGWLADKFFGFRKSVFYGGTLIAIGHFSLAFPYTETFFVGLLFIVLGTGLLKPNVSTMVGELYSPEDQTRRDAGFSIFYMGINIGGFLGPLLVGYLGENVNWHYGFTLAGVGMVLGLIQYKLTETRLGDAGLSAIKITPALEQSRKKIKAGLWVFVVLLLALVLLLITRVIYINPIVFARASGIVIAIAALIYFAYVLLVEKLERNERKKTLAIFIIFIVTTLFYAGYEGQGSSLTLFADRYSDMFIGSFEMPASWMQMAPSLCVVVFVPFFTWLWFRLERKNLNPSTPVKIALGLFWMGLGYVVMIAASKIVVAGDKPLSSWLWITYMLHTFGEICLYPIGLSGVTKLSPKKLVGQMMGVFFMALALGNLIAGLYAGEFDENSITANPSLLIDLFARIVKIMFVGMIVVLLFSKPLRKLMGNIR